MTSATDALKRLRDGNQRFVNGDNSNGASMGQARRAELIDGQNPFAIILACSDSRVPVELVFDQGLGDLFVIRVAGNIAAPTQIGSIEYAAALLGTKLVVVMGHSNCGAVDATLKAMSSGQNVPSANLQEIIDRIRPTLSGLDFPSLDDAVVANVRNSMARLRSDSPILEELAESGQLTIVGAEYSIDSGEITFLESPS